MTEEKVQKLVKERNYMKAIPIVEAIIEETSLKLGENHEKTLMSMHWLGYCWMEQKEYSKALSIFEKVVKVRTSSLGENHKSTIESTHMLAFCYTRKTGKPYPHLKKLPRN